MSFNELYDIRLPGFIFMGLAVIILFLFILLIGKRRLPAVSELIILYITLFIWAVGAIFESGALTYELRLKWSQIAYIGTVFAPVCMFLFIQAYTHINLVRKPVKIAALFLLPVIYLVLAWTNSKHELVWPSITINPETNLAVYEHGIAFWIFFAYSYLLIIFAWVMLIMTLIRLDKVFRIQAIIIILAVLMIVSGNLLYLLPFNPLKGLDWTLVGIIISVFLLTFDIFRLRLFDLVPTARKRLMDVMNEGMLFVDEKENILDFNINFLKAVGLAEEDEYIGRQLGEVLQHQKDLLKLIRYSIKNDHTIKTEILINQVDYAMHVQKVSHSKRQTSGRLIIFNDVSSLKEIEKNLFAMNQQLQAEITTKQLLIDELDTYAHTVAHDLKSPLAQMAGFSELMIEEIENKEYDKMLDYSRIINDSSHNLVHIIDELLLLALIRSSDIRKSKITVEPCFNGALKRLDGEIKQSNAIIHSPEEWIPVFGFQNWIQEVFVNYISNAIKYGGSPPVIDVTVKEKNNLVWYSVTDNGNGIPEKMMDRLFIAYSRLETTKADGHGLGLSIVKRIIEKLGGQVKVENVKGKGACFSFGLPVHH